MLEPYLTMGGIRYTHEGENYVIPIAYGGALVVESLPVGWRISLQDAEGNVEATVHHATLDDLLKHILVLAKD